MNTKKWYIANWKNYFSYSQAQQWIATYKQPLDVLARKHSIIICPSFESLSSVAGEIKDTAIQLGAQNCSSHNAGAYTGQVLIESLKQIGCRYCILGHPEIQRVCPESFSILAQKASKLLDQGINPILCIAETAQEYEQSRGPDILRLNLEEFCNSLMPSKQPNLAIGIAYEPVWAINSNTLPPIEYIESQLSYAKTLCLKYAPSYNFLFLYGGGIDETTVREFKNIETLDGFLIGRASTDFQKLQKIVEL